MKKKDWVQGLTHELSLDCKECKDDQSDSLVPAKEKINSEAQGLKGLDTTQMYLDAIGQSPLLTAEQEVTYARSALQGDHAARQRMIESNLRLVVSKIGRASCRERV